MSTDKAKEAKAARNKTYRETNKEKLKLYYKIYAELNKDRIRSTKRERYIENKETIKEYKREYDKVSHRKNPSTIMWRCAKKRASKSGLPFNILVQDIIVPETCPYLETQLIVGRESGIYNSPSLDKIVPELGYTKGNVQVISHKANMCKQDLTIEELVTFAKNILKLHGEYINDSDY